MELATIARAGHDLGLAAWFGGYWMGAVGMNAATREVDDHYQRTRVANAGWFRWAPIATLSIVSYLSGAFYLYRLRLLPRPSPLMWLRVFVTLAAMGVTLETGRSGREVVRAGDVPVATAVQPISQTPSEVATAQRRLRIAQWAVPSLTGCLWLLNAWETSRR